MSFMKHISTILVLAAVLSAGVHQVHAAEKSTFQTGKLVDLRRDETRSGAARAQGSFCLAVELGDMTFVSRYEPYWRWTYEPSDLVVGDPIEIAVKGENLYIKRPKGGDVKTHITRRERNSADQEPVTCALPVTNRN